MLFYDQYFRKFGVRLPGHLLTPVMPSVGLLELPQNSIYHYVGESAVDKGPASDEWIFRHVTKMIPVYHILKLLDHKGNPRPNTVPLDQEINGFHSKNRRYRRMRQISMGLRDPLAPLVINYAFLNSLYRYQRTMFAEYNRWYNINATIWKTMADLTAETDRNQFIVLGLPNLLPGLTDLRIAAESLDEDVEVISQSFQLAIESIDTHHPIKTVFEKQGSLALEAMNARMLRVFHSPQSLILLEIWKWIGPNRASSVINAIPTEKLGRINLIFQESGRWICLNLNVLNQWRKATPAEIEQDPNAVTKGIEAIQMQKRFLRLMMSLFQVRTDVSPEVSQSIDKKEEGPVKTQADTPVQQTGEPKAVVDVPIKVVTPDTSNIDPATKTTRQDVTLFDIPQAIGTDDNSPRMTNLDHYDDEAIERDLADLDRIMQQRLEESEAQLQGQIRAPLYQTPESGIHRVANKLAEDGLLSAAALRHFQELAQSYKRVVSPDGKQTLEEFIRIPKHMTAITEVPKIPDIETVPDKSMLESTLLDFDSRYIKDVFHRDICNMVMTLQNAGVCVKDIKRERHESITGSYDNWAIHLAPVDGASSILRFRTPVIDEDGTYVAGGVKYHLRKQRGDLPLRKIAPNIVTATSYYGKLFIERTERKANDYYGWINSTIMKRGLDKGDPIVFKIQPTNVFDPDLEAPRLYSSLAMSFKTFTAGGFEWLLDHEEMLKVYPAEVLGEEDWKSPTGGRLIARNAKGEYLLVDKESALWLLTPGDGGFTRAEYQTMEEILELDPFKAPIEFAEARIFSRMIPIGFILAYQMGLSTLMRSLAVQPRIVPAGTRLNLQANEFALVFQDESFVLSRDNPLAVLILGGLTTYDKELRQYPSHEFDKPDVYLSLLESDGNSVSWLREISLMYQMFIDPITKEILAEMNEPTDFEGLLFRACEMLLNDQHPDEFDPRFMRVKGLERMAGAVFGELVRSVRAHNGTPGKSRMPIEMHPHAVWGALQKDPAKGLVKDINPIQNLKEIESLTFSGVGGRSSRSMTKRSRRYHLNDLGVTSESTVDSGSVGINTYMCANPLFTNLRGIARPYVIGEDSATSLLSTTSLISPAADRDDIKRSNFAGIQMGHAIAARDYRPSPVRTGYEQIIAHRTSDLYATTAKQDGRVISRDTNGIIVEYADGSRKGIELGRRYGKSEGLTLPHEVITHLKVGDEIKRGDVVAYNPAFFARDVLNPKQVVWKVGILVRTVLWESTQTLEDSSSVSRKVADMLTTTVTKTRTILVNFDQSVRNLVKVGQDLGGEDILCFIEDAVTANTGLFDNTSLDTLRVMSAQAPQAKAKGFVERIELYYHGDVEDMSDSLRAIAKVSDKEIAARYKAVGKPEFTGQVDDSFRIEGNSLPLDACAIQIYITQTVPVTVADKGVFANQLKTVFGEVMERQWTTEDGQPIDAIFGAASVGNRIVTNAYVSMTTAGVLDGIGQLAVKMWRGQV